MTIVAALLLLPTTALAAKPSRGQPRVPTFVDETASAGLDHRYDGEYQFFTGGGVAVLDCDDDGLPDLFLAGGAEPAGLFRNESQVGGDLAFSQVPSETTDLTEVTGAYPIDIDSDGIGDLVVLRRGENVLLRGVGDCAFERANEALGFDGGDGWTVSFSAKWDPGATLPTLALGDYLDHRRVPEGARLRRRGRAPAGRRRPGLRGARTAPAGVVPAVDPLQRLGPLGAAGPARQQRPPVLPAPGGRGAALAGRAGPGARRLDAGGGLAAGPAGGHEHRQ